MRRLLTFPCGGVTLGASLDESVGTTGILFVTGGTQTRIGSHRMFERLARALADAGYPCFRFDRRGTGDSEGEDPGWRDSSPDIVAAGQSFRDEVPQLNHIFGLGLCDGATALALFGHSAGLDGLILANPWLVEAKADAPPAAAIRRHYVEQLTSLSGWRKILSGSISYAKLFKGIRKVAAPPASALTAEVAQALARMPAEFIFASKDATAIAAQAALKGRDFASVGMGAPVMIETNSHTFARPGDADAFLAASLQALERLSGRG